jgi:predicted ribosome quality control (RQC) complex YloA/Tae2 family protein
LLNDKNLKKLKYYDLISDRLNTICRQEFVDLFFKDDSIEEYRKNITDKWEAFLGNQGKDNSKNEQSTSIYKVMKY